MIHVIHPHAERGRTRAFDIEFVDGVATVDALHPERERALLQHGFSVIHPVERPSKPRRRKGGS